jgi:hypothetical protein
LRHADRLNRKTVMESGYILTMVELEAEGWRMSVGGIIA